MYQGTQEYVVLSLFSNEETCSWGWEESKSDKASVTDLKSGDLRSRDVRVLHSVFLQLFCKFKIVSQ